MQLHSVVTTGSALAACLRTVATSGEGYGFLIGRVVSRTSKILQDSASGLLEAVQQQLHTDSILGWFAYRSSSSLQPTAQDEMLSRSMASARNSLWGQQQSTVLFALVSLQQCHDGASQDFQQRTFQLNSNSHKLEPVDMHIRCMGQAGTLAQRYRTVVPPPLLARVPSFTRKTVSDITQNASERPQSSTDVSPSMLRTVAYTGLQSQVEAVESIYRKTVRQLEQMAHKACITCAP